MMPVCPLSAGTTRVISLERQVRIVAGSLVVIGIVLGYFVHPGSSASPRLWAPGWFFAGSRISAAWACFSQSCLGMPANLREESYGWYLL